MIRRVLQTSLVGVCLPVCLFCDLMVYGVLGALHGAALALDWAWGVDPSTRPSYLWSVPPMTVKWFRRMRGIWS